MNRRRILLHALIFLISFNAMIYGIGGEPYPYFDEVRYVSAARQFNQKGSNENWSHPPLGKILIGVGMSVAGDTPFGWRWLSVVFGALSLNAIFALGLIFFASEIAAVQVVILGFLNQLLFVQSRIAMLEIFMLSFILWALVFLLTRWRQQTALQFAAAGILLGLAAATKWFAIVFLPFAIAAFFLNSNWRLRLKKTLLIFISTFAISYGAIFLFYIGMENPPYAPALAHSEKKYQVRDFIKLQGDMFLSQTVFSTINHPSQSAWYKWPFMPTPTWYAEGFKNSDTGELLRSSVVLIGNPLILWFGFLSIGVCIFAWIKQRVWAAKMISILYLISLLSWMIIPRKATFFYYYLTASMFLSLSLVFSFRYLKIPRWGQWIFVALAAAVFLYFYPLLSSVYLPEKDAFGRLWFASWTPPN